MNQHLWSAILLLCSPSNCASPNQKFSPPFWSEWPKRLKLLRFWFWSLGYKQTDSRCATHGIRACHTSALLLQWGDQDDRVPVLMLGKMVVQSPPRLRWTYQFLPSRPGSREILYEWIKYPVVKQWEYLEKNSSLHCLLEGDRARLKVQMKKTVRLAQEVAK